MQADHRTQPLQCNRWKCFGSKNLRDNGSKMGTEIPNFTINPRCLGETEQGHRVLKIDGEWISDDNRLMGHITNYFINLFGRQQGDTDVPREDWRGSKINANQADCLCRPAHLDEEVRTAVFGMKRWGSLGPDGIQVAFYQDFWDQIGVGIKNFVNSALNSGKVPPVILEAFMTLIPKKDCPENARDFRPIILLNVIFKIISKVIVNRMRPIMQTLIVRTKTASCRASRRWIM